MVSEPETGAERWVSPVHTTSADEASGWRTLNDAVQAAYEAGVAAGRTQAAEDIAREIEEELPPPLACAWTKAEAAAIARNYAAEETDHDT